MTKKPIPLTEEDDEALMERVEAVARQQGLPSLTPSSGKQQARGSKPMKPIKLIVPEYLFPEVYRHETLAAAVKGSGVVGVMTSGLLAQAAFASVQACR
jgi:hypothetical protein